MEYNTIFKRYDIRGKYPAELDEIKAKILAKVYFRQVKPEKVILGHDNILGSDSLSNVFGSELLRLGCTEVISIGMVPTPVLYYSASHLKFVDALMFTASHLGEGYTGVKPLRHGIPLPEETLSAMRIDYETQLEREIPEHSGSSISGDVKLKHVSVNSDYCTELKNLIRHRLAKYRIVADVGNGPITPLVNDILAPLGIPYSIINREIRSRGLAHPSNPKIKQNRAQLENAVRGQNADLGIIWDGDCDRCLFIDRDGELICPEFVAKVIATRIKKVAGYSCITADVRASSAIEDVCNKNGIIVKRIKAWHVPIKEEMEKDPNIGFGFEVSGHYVFQDFYKIDDGMLAMLYFLDGLNNEESRLEDLLSDFRSKYFIPEEINYRTTVSEEMLQKKLSAKYYDGRINLIDGISVDYPEWRFNARSSRTEPIIRLNISGTSKDLVLKHLQAIEKEIDGERI